MVDAEKMVSALKLHSGRVAIAYNPTCTPDPQPGKAAWPGLRCPVAVVQLHGVYHRLWAMSRIWVTPMTTGS